MEGQMDFSPADLESYLFQLAVHLTGIHQVDNSTLDLSFLPETANGCIEVGRERPPNVDPALEEARVRQALAAYLPLRQQNTSTLLHGDYWPGNTLWQGNKLAAVIDWEDAKVGDPLIDLAISRLDIAWIFGIEAMNAFTAHYQSLIALDDTNLPYWDLCAALRIVRLAGSDLAAWAAYFRPFDREDITVQSLKENYHYFVNQAFVNW
jgi:aminoglycoside phosphotransferase (APT) family kinase protein